MSDRDAQEPEMTLAEVAKARMRERDALWEAAHAGEHPELRPLDDLEQARLAAAVTPRRRPRSIVIAPILAAAAAILLFLVLRTGGGALPEYTLSVRSGDQIVRSEDAPPSARYAKGSRVELVLQPATPVRDEVEVTVEARDRTGKMVALRWPVERGREGALRIVTTLGDELSAGDWELVIRLGGGARELRHSIRVVGEP